jgi:flagellar biosynthesis GTPase FlhF
MLDHDKILSFMKMIGPTTPTAVAKNIKSDVLLASALLSDLSAQNKVKVSKLKIGGGSPLYFLPGQEEQLFKFAEENFNPKDYQVLLQLKERKLLREKELELLGRVALRSLKDFAIPLNVNIHGLTELFWKWHLLSNEEANNMIGDFVNSQNQKVVEESKVAVEKDGKQIKEEEAIIEKKEPEVQEPVSEVKSESQKTESFQDEEFEQETEELEELEVKKESVSKKSEPLEEKKQSESKKEEVHKKESKKEEPTTESKDSEPAPKEQKSEVKKEKITIEKKEEQKKLSTEEKKSFIQKVRDKVTKKRKVVDDEFLPQLEDFFISLKITIDQKETLRKNAEMNFLLTVPSVVGNITYFCKAKNKSRCDERDLSAAYMEAQAKRLPLLFLYTNELNKKSLELMESGAFENVAVKKVE